MTIYIGSRYEEDRVFLAPKKQNPTLQQSVLHRQWDEYQIVYTEYLWRSGDRLDYLAYQQYGDPALWWYIAESNPNIVDISDIKPGTVLRVPNG